MTAVLIVPSLILLFTLFQRRPSMPAAPYQIAGCAPGWPARSWS